MRRFSLVIVFVLLQSTIYSQTEDAFELCYAIQQNYNQFTSNSEANDALNRILYVTGATPNFILMECDKINNAVAVTYKGERYILYDKKFLSLVSSNTSSWSNTFILAHEVGHHINGHTKDIALGSILSKQELEQQRQEELDADYYAGFVLAKLGATLSETNAAINLIGSQGDDRFSTHPDRNKRIEYITRGWNNGVERNVSQENTLLPGEEKLSGEWIQFRSGKENPFDDEEIYAYTIGRTLPVNANTANIKPKLIVDHWGNYYITNLNFSTKFNVSYEIINAGKLQRGGELITRYFITELSSGKEKEINSILEFNLLQKSKEYANPRKEITMGDYTYVDIEKDELKEIIDREIEQNKDEIYKSIVKQSNDKDSSRPNHYDGSTSIPDWGDDYRFQVVWDEKKSYTPMVPPNSLYTRFYFADFTPSQRFQIQSGYSLEYNFLRNLKSKNRLLLKPNWGGKYNGKYFIDKSDIQIELIITLERVIPEDIYFEFDLKGSSKALLFD